MIGSTPSRRGFAILAVLWMMTGVAALALTIALGARGAVATVRNRMMLTRAKWQAEDCLERARAAIAPALRDAQSGRPDQPRFWLRLDSVVQASRLLTECPGSVTLTPVGIAVPVNGAGDERLRRLFSARGIDGTRADSLVDALLDWRDDDTVPRSRGAESEWYERRNRAPPRNGPLPDLGEVAWIRGFEPTDSTGAVLDSVRAYLSVENGRTVLDLAPGPVLASLPGITEETVARLLERRVRHAPPLRELSDLGGELSRSSRDSLVARYADLMPLVTTEPDAWIVTARSSAAAGTGEPDALVATIEIRLVRSGPRGAIVRRRTSP